VIDRIVVWALRLKSELGQDIMEYALLGGFIALAAAAAFVLLPIDDAMGDFARTVGNCVALSDTYSCP
jgi:Flp pilus assembly pilin Flp